ncbi:MAG: serine/threonine protein kinase [candidate division Zixibacteria bacterium]|nr:serine/threonine protein kinase [candidate division Zixibacteria bacterium]
MPFVIDIDAARRDYPQFAFIKALTPSEQKAAFHVRDNDGNDLCLKIISPDCDTDRIKREIDALVSISHPNLARLVEYTYSSRPSGQRHYIVEEFVDGHDLSAKLQTEQPWQLQDVAQFFAKLCDGLSELRKLELVHRDLKPSNIRVRADWTPVIIDFGLVRHLKLPDITQTIDGARFGTPAYFAPEQCRGTKHDIEHRTDLFALGILMYQSLTGAHPFLKPQMTVKDLYDGICDSQDHLNAPIWVGLPSRWRLIGEKLLKKDRTDRPYDATQVAAVLRKLGGIA